MSDTPGTAQSDVGMAYSATGVNACIFRINALTSHKGLQYVTYYDADGFVVVGQRELGKSSWQLNRLEIQGNVRDAHNSTVIGVSADGILHLSYDHHNHPPADTVSAAGRGISLRSAPPDR